jgi:hypothetical protein
MREEGGRGAATPTMRNGATLLKGVVSLPQSVGGWPACRVVIARPDVTTRSIAGLVRGSVISTTHLRLTDVTRSHT